ncbi:peptidyl-prolyl cis-trans isomerase [Balneolales bacterium ANBcel1]|nr:peptidyl-prolyl cis-trans isomerase [Balneolales bacterium ANBcel1]
MQKLRSGTKYIIWILILSFGLLWVLADTQVFDAMMAGPRNMGEVNREPISYAEFNQRVNLFTEQHREQTGASPDTEVRAQYEEMAWEQLVVDRILQQRMRDLGITVTDRELVEMVTGDNPDPFIRQQFTREDGTIDRIALQNAIESPENREIWIMIEQQLREQRRQQKLNQYLEASLRVSDFEIQQHYKEQNSRASLRYVRFPYSDISSDEIEIADSDIQAFYNNNKQRFHRNKSWRFSYVTFSIEPTPEDTARVLNQLADLREDFRQAENAEQFLRNNFSETSYFDSFLSPNEVRREHLRVFELDVDDVTEPYIYNNRAHMLRLLEERSSDQTYERVRQIRLRNNDQDRALAYELMERLNRGESFAELARSYSRHSASAERGGELGYVSRGGWSEDVLANVVSNTAVGQIAGPIQGEDNISLLELVDRTNREVRFADLSRDIEADPFETIQRLANEAEDFQYFAEADGFVDEAERSGFVVEEAVATEGSPFIAGLGQSRLLLNELAHMRRGDISDVIETEERFIVFRVDEVIPEGPRPLEEVRSQVESLVRDQKRKELMTRRVNEMLEGHQSLEAFAEQHGKQVRTVESVRLSASTVSGAGREPKLVGAAFSLPEGRLSPVIDGNNAAFVMVVDERTMADPSAISSSDRREIRNTLQQRKNQAFTEVWVDRVKAGADIRDFRVQQRMMQPQAPM